MDYLLNEINKLISSPLSLIFLISFIFTITSSQLRKRRMMMTAKFTGDTFGAAYLFLMGGTSGACASTVAGLGALIQAITPHNKLKTTIIPRITGAIILSIIGAYFSYRAPIDLLPVTAVIICRFGELQNSSQKIRIVYWFANILWVTYSIISGYFLYAAFCIILNLSLLSSIIKRYKQQSTTVEDD